MSKGRVGVVCLAARKDMDDNAVWYSSIPFPSKKFYDRVVARCMYCNHRHYQEVQVWNKVLQ